MNNSVHPNYPNRNIMHKWLSPPSECPECWGTGWTVDEEGFDAFANCPCGKLRQSFYDNKK